MKVQIRQRHFTYTDFFGGIPRNILTYTIKLVHEYVQKDDVYSFSGVFYVVTLYVVAAYVVTAYVVST